MKTFSISFLLLLSLVFPVYGQTYLRFTDLVGTAYSEKDCRRMALNYLNNLRRHKDLVVDPVDYFEYYPQVNDCYAVHFEKLEMVSK